MKGNLKKEHETLSQVSRIDFYARIAIAAILVSGVLAFCLMKAISTVQFDSQTIIPQTNAASNVSDENGLHFVSKVDWLGEMESEPLDQLYPPVHLVVMSHTVTEGCNFQASCIFRVQTIQRYHMAAREFSDIAYNFLIGGDGYVYVGRGWNSQGAHTRGYNFDSIGIAFIGTFNKYPPSEKQLNAAKLLIAEGVRLEKVAEDYRLFGFMQLGRMRRTGLALLKEISTWPHWTFFYH